MKFLLLQVLLMMSLLLSSCATVSFSESETREKEAAAYEKVWSHQFLGRVIGLSNVRTTCPEGQEVSQFEVKLTGGQWWVGTLTGVYSPVTSSYWCE